MELLTVKGVAAALKISSRQVWKLLSSGRLPTPVRLSRSVRWRAADVALFVQLSCDMRQFEAMQAGNAAKGGAR
jgi:predicted DNA-binding transcriptional regulator AlpA